MNHYKAGARHSAADLAEMQSMHDLTVRQGATCGATKAAQLPIKATDDGRVSGFLVRYGGPDVDGDHFVKGVDFGLKDGQTVDLLFHHGLDKAIGADPIGQGTVEHQAGGLWFSGWLSKRAKYLQFILKMAEAGMLGFSSGADPLSVVRVPIAGKAREYTVKAWRIREASLTPVPAAGPAATMAALKTVMDQRAARIRRELDILEEEIEDDARRAAIERRMAAVMLAELDALERGIRR